MKIFENLIGIIDFSTDILMNSLASGSASEPRSNVHFVIFRNFRPKLRKPFKENSETFWNTEKPH